MKQFQILMRILKTPNVFSTEGERGKAKENLDEKLLRKNKRALKKTQTTLPL